MNRTLTFMATLVIVCLVSYLLIVGKGIIIPLVISFFIWHLINTLDNYMHKIPYVGEKMPNIVGMLLSFLVIGIFLLILIAIIANNVNDVIAASSRYQDNLLRIMNNIDNYFNIKILPSLKDMVKNLNIQHILLGISSTFTSIMSSAILIFLYVIFLFVEQHFFQYKLDVLFTKPASKKLVMNILTHIDRDTQTYLGLKTLSSLIIALASWIIMKSVSLDFAEFWGLLIFFLSYIPNIGAIIATAFPAILALIQFESWVPFVVIMVGLSIVQFIMGNFIEPKLMGQSLNLSTFVIIFSLALWGSFWGILGMILAVPVTVMLMIIFAHFKSTRSIAILLSQDGNIKKAYEIV